MNNRVAFITGASRGIGRACAQALSLAGARVILAARNREKLEELAGEIRAAGREAYVVEIDLSSSDSIKQAFAKAHSEFGVTEVLVNNAGVTKDGLAVRMKQEDWQLRAEYKPDRGIHLHAASAAADDARSMGTRSSISARLWARWEMRARRTTQRQRRA